MSEEIGKEETGAASDRREFIKNAGRFALVAPPAMTMLLSTSMSSPAIAKSVCRPDDKKKDKKKAGYTDCKDDGGTSGGGGGGSHTGGGGGGGWDDLWNWVYKLLGGK